MGKKGKKEKTEPAVKDGTLPVDMSRKQLITHAMRLNEELEREKEERNFFMMEREKLYQRWNLYMEQIAIEKAKVQASKSHLQDSKKVQREEDNLQNQKLRFLKAEQTRKLGQLRLLHLQQMAQAQDDAWLIHMVIKEEVMNKKKEIRRAQMAFYQLIRGLHWKHAKQVSDLRDEFAVEIRRLESSADRSLFERNERTDEMQDKEMAKLATGKEDQIRFMIEDHAWQVDQMKNFFQELLKTSLDIVNQMKMEVKQQTTAELMQRRDYEHFKHRYDVYVGPALRWRALMDEWLIAHQEDDLGELISTLTTKEEELKRRKYNLRMIEAANEALNQRIIICEKERNCVKRQFCRAIVDSQRTASMRYFVQQLKKKAAASEAELYETLNKTVEMNGQSDDFNQLLDKRDMEVLDHLHDINDYAMEHETVNRLFAETFLKNEINLAELGFPVKGTGVTAVSQQDLDLAIAAEIEKRNKRQDLRETPVPAKSLPRLESKKSAFKNTPNEPPPPSMVDESEVTEEDELEWLPEEVEVLDMEDYYNMEGQGETNLEWNEEEISIPEGESEMEDEQPSVATDPGRGPGEE